MLRIEMHESADSMTIRMEGRFVSKFAEDAKSLISRCTLPAEVIVDLSEVTFVDAAGAEVLTWLGEIGVQFVAEDAYSHDVCERLGLSLAGKV